MDFLEKFSKSLPPGVNFPDFKNFCPSDIWQSSPERAAIIALEKSGLFDGMDYLLRYADVAAARMNPIFHFVKYGINEGRIFRAPVASTPPALENTIFAKKIEQNNGDGQNERSEAKSGEVIEISNLVNFGATWGRGHEKLVQLTPRPDISDFIIALENYDIISFDIFDTALLRKVEFPQNIFDILALEMNWHDFTNARKEAENTARLLMYKKAGHREITLAHIYEQLKKRYGVDPAWMQREIELEETAAIVNPYILNVYKALQYRGKTIIFTSDMYLPEEVIVRMLKSAGYYNYHRLYLSNTLSIRKGDGSLQKKLLADYNGKRIIHIGDNKVSDVITTAANGIDALWYPECRMASREPYLNNLTGSIYRAVINNSINNGLWRKNRHYTHGFRVGGILTAGYCSHINEIAARNKVDKILFCGRDCYIIQKVYDKFYRKYNNCYVETSRISAMLLTPERYLYDILQRFILRHWDENGASLTLWQLLDETGFSYLVKYLEQYNLNPFAFCCSSKKEVFKEFIFSCIDEIKRHTLPHLYAAKKYFAHIIGDSNSILIADVGWSGTCINAITTFIHQQFSANIKVIGTLICASNNIQMANAIIGCAIYPYVSSPIYNSDLSNFMTPPGKNIQTSIDRVHMPLEYLFTAPTASHLAYEEKQGGDIGFVRDNNAPPNLDEINEIQAGIYDFNAIFADYIHILPDHHIIAPYTAFIPLMNAIRNDEYCQEIYKNFLYDACTASGSFYTNKFTSFFPQINSEKDSDEAESLKKIIFVTPELTYTGTPQSLLRTARVVRELGFEPVVWSAKDGPFHQEFIKENIPVQIIDPKNLDNTKKSPLVKGCCLAYCNTILTDGFVRYLCAEMPTIWFIREATNISAFCINNPDRLALLKNYDKIYCVSEYARNAIAKYTDKEIHVLRNCVEDESKYAIDYNPGSGKTVKFAQFGTMEYRKGYDVLVAAFKALPEKYKNKCELYFAGGFINSGAPYCEYLFQEMRNEPNIHYLGILKGVKDKIETLSSMDVVVVASRDESCSLVALEGAMLSKPLIVTQNVGAKYMVGEKNGLVVPAGDVQAMRIAMIKMIDHGEHLAAMGQHSRQLYETEASMETYRKDIEELISQEVYEGKPKVLISLTSYPERIPTIIPCIESLLNQEYIHRLLILWLSKEQFPNLEEGLPERLICLLKKNIFEIRWVPEDLKPHKKYFYAMREFSDLPIVTVDDDAIYEPQMLGELVASYMRHPQAISCHRANLIRMNKQGKFKPYDSWPMDYSLLKDTPSYQLMPTGVGGVLYPPHSLPEKTFDMNAIKTVCLMADDIWLKMMTTYNNYPVVVAKNKCEHKLIPGSQEGALWKNNVVNGNNDKTLNNIFDYMPSLSIKKEDIIAKIWHGLYAN